MKKQVGFIGIGQCGGNIVSLIEGMGYDCCCVNTSQEDLDSLKNVKHKIHIRNGEGASKNRKAVLQLAAQSVDELITNITNINNQKYLFVIFSAGGGTGSGLGTFVSAYLANSGHVVIPVVVLPDEDKESVKACENAYNACSELNAVNNLGATILLDNGNINDKFYINQKFAKDIDAMLNMNTHSALGNLDTSEIKTMLSTAGVMSILKLSKARSTASGILNNINNTIYVDIAQKAPSIIGISTCNKSLELNDIVKGFPSVYDTFYGVSEDRTVVVFSGMQFPMERMQTYKDKIESLKCHPTVHQDFAPLQERNLVQNANIQSKQIDSRSLLMSFLNS